MLNQVVVALILFCLQEEGLQVLLDSREKEYFLPFLSPLETESLEQAVTRLVASRVDHKEAHRQQLQAYGEAGLPLMVVFLGTVPPGTGLIGGTSTWMPVDESIRLSPSEGDMLKHALGCLRSQVSQGRLVLSFLRSEFTLGEVQRACELITGEKLDKRNFRRQLLGSGIVEPVSRQRSGQGRPALLYRTPVVKK